MLSMDRRQRVPARSTFAAVPARPPARPDVETLVRLATVRPDDITQSAAASWLQPIETVTEPMPGAERRTRPSEALHAEFFAAELRRAQDRLDDMEAVLLRTGLRLVS